VPLSRPSSPRSTPITKTADVAFRAALSREDEDMDLEFMLQISRLVYSRAARGRRREALLVPRNRC
jgi:hypothetical protein